MIKRSMMYLGAAVIVASALAGCSSTSPSGGGTTDDSSSSAPSSSAPSSSAPASANALDTASTSLGTVVVDGKGMTVYYFTKDVKDSGKSNCSGQCLALWPAVVAPSTNPQVEGVTGTVGTITRDDGTMQVTINGLPVYTYAKDNAAGDVTGQGVGDAWYVIAPSGDAITDAAKTGY
jgi:predicted lipoprotein with Yx(FWY)xxD motif